MKPRPFQGSLGLEDGDLNIEVTISEGVLESIYRHAC